jgi:hypothetical protein
VVSVRRSRGLRPRFWWASLDSAVNKRLLSTGETGEFARGNAGFDLNLGVDRAAPRCLSSNRRERVARKNLRNVGDTGEKTKNAAVNKTRPLSWGGDGLAPRHGFEPRFTAPKAAVLPLDDRGKSSEACPLSVTQPSRNLKDLAGTSRSRIDQRPKDVRQF